MCESYVYIFCLFVCVKYSIMPTIICKSLIKMIFQLKSGSLIRRNLCYPTIHIVDFRISQKL